MTDKQKKAIANLKKALTAVDKAGLNILVMDDQVSVVTKKFVREYSKLGNYVDYGEVADAYKFASYEGYEEEIETFAGTVDHTGGW